VFRLLWDNDNPIIIQANPTILPNEKDPSSAYASIDSSFEERY